MPLLGMGVQVPPRTHITTPGPPRRGPGVVPFPDPGGGARFGEDHNQVVPTTLDAAINLRLAQLGLPLPEGYEDTDAARLARPILARQRELSRRLADRLCATDQRIQDFLDDYLADAGERPRLPRRTLVLDEPGLARALSLPFDGDSFSSPLLSSYRLVNGVLHNPANDRRTTAGVFHIAEGGLPIPDDKLAVPKETFARLLARALQPPETDLVLPYTANEATPAGCFVSLLLRPLVSPEVPGFGAREADGDALLRARRHRRQPRLRRGHLRQRRRPVPARERRVAGTRDLDRSHRLRHPRAAPDQVTKKEVGLPHVSEATERQQRDGMCWETEDELYNGGRAFKVCARDARGVIVTVIADNYFGYCKKEVKTQISYSANLFGNAEEEHAGGALVFASYNLGQEYDETSSGDDYTLAEVLERDPERFDGAAAGSRRRPRAAAHRPRPRWGALLDARHDGQSGPGPTAAPGRCPLRAGQDLPEPERLPGDRGAAAARPEHLDPGRHRARTRRRATSRHRLRRRQVGDLQGDHRRVHRRLGVRRPTSTTTWTRSPAILDRDFSRRFLDPERNGTDLRPILSPRPLGRVGHQAAHPVALGVHRRLQRLARAHPALRQGARLRRQALLPPGVGRRLAQPLQRGGDRRPAGQLAAPRRHQGHPQHAARRLRRRRLVAPVQPAARLLAGGEGADPGRHHGIHRRARRPPGARPGTARTSSSRTARACSSSAPTTRSTAATTPRPSATSPPPAPSCPTSSR